MTSKKIGEFEELVLLAVCILDDNALWGISQKRDRKTQQSVHSAWRSPRHPLPSSGQRLLNF